MKNKQIGFIQIPILIAIVIGVAAIGSSISFGVVQYKSYQKELASKEKQSKETQELLKSQQKTIEEIKKGIENPSKQSLSNQSAEKEKTKPPVGQTTQSIQNNYDLPSIIAAWRPRIAHIKCAWTSQSGEIIEGFGSGVLDFPFTLPYRRIITNAHVVTYQGFGPDSCTVKLPDDPQPIIAKNSDILISTEGYDWGIIKIENPDSYIKNLEKTLEKDDNYTYGQFLPLCREQEDRAIGNRVIILGYPAIGSQSDITASEGIISGYDGDYFITTAKIERGNSGGIAISIRGVIPKGALPCYLGIPTFARVGEIESLARVLSVKTVPEYNMGIWK